MDGTEDRHISPLYFNKVEDVYEGEDGKQRTLTIIKFLKDEFELSGLDEFLVVSDDGEAEEIDVNGYKFSDLPECFRNAIKKDLCKNTYDWYCADYCKISQRWIL